MDALAHDVMDEATLFQVIRGDGGIICFGTIRSEVTDEDGNAGVKWATRVHIATSEAEVVRQLKFYLRSNQQIDNAGEL